MSILATAHNLVHGERNESYGHPLQDFQRVAVMWSGVLNQLVTPEQVGLCLIALKLARECYQHQRDTLVDIAGYAETLQMIADTKELPPCGAKDVDPVLPTNADTSSAPPVTVSTLDAAKDDSGTPLGTCPRCRMFLPSHGSHLCPGSETDEPLHVYQGMEGL